MSQGNGFCAVRKSGLKATPPLRKLRGVCPESRDRPIPGSRATRQLIHLIEQRLSLIDELLRRLAIDYLTCEFCSLQ